MDFRVFFKNELPPLPQPPPLRSPPLPSPFNKAPVHEASRSNLGGALPVRDSTASLANHRCTPWRTLGESLAQTLRTLGAPWAHTWRTPHLPMEHPLPTFATPLEPVGIFFGTVLEPFWYLFKTLWHTPLEPLLAPCWPPLLNLLATSLAHLRHTISHPFGTLARFWLSLAIWHAFGSSLASFRRPFWHLFGNTLG